MSGITQYRDLIAGDGKVPRWLRGTTGGRLLYSFGLILDLLRYWAVCAVKARFPGFLRSATPYLCRDRKVMRGPEELEEQICARLRKWKKSAVSKGGAASLLEQLWAYLTPYSPRMRVVNNSGRYWEISTDGEITLGEMEWNWDGNTALWSRFWLLIWAPEAWLASEGLVGDSGVVGDGGTLGTTALPPIVAGVRALIDEWSSRNARHMHTIVILDAETWEEEQPDGTWGRLSARSHSARYWAGLRD